MDAVARAVVAMPTGFVAIAAAMDAVAAVSAGARAVIAVATAAQCAVRIGAATRSAPCLLRGMPPHAPIMPLMRCVIRLLDSSGSGEKWTSEWGCTASIDSVTCVAA